MLAVVKTPRINEISINGSDAEDILAYLQQRYAVAVMSQAGDDNELLDANHTEYHVQNRWRLLLGYRCKKGLTQKKLAELSGIRQSILSEYERGRRPLTFAAAVKLAGALNTEPENLLG